MIERRLRSGVKDVGAENDFMERSWLQLMCCAPVSGHGVVAYFGVGEVAKTEVLRIRVKGVEVDKERLGPDDVNLQTEELHCNYSVLIVRAE